MFLFSSSFIYLFPTLYFLASRVLLVILLDEERALSGMKMRRDGTSRMQYVANIRGTHSLDFRGINCTATVAAFDLNICSMLGLHIPYVYI